MALAGRADQTAAEADPRVTDAITGRARKCARCGRRLSDPASVARGLGPVCYARSGGGVFDGELDADTTEWGRREQLLAHGGEHDFGYADYALPGGSVAARGLRISVRRRGGAYEAYGRILVWPDPDPGDEVVFYRGDDIRACWAAAVAAIPACNAVAEAERRRQLRAARRVA